MKILFVHSVKAKGFDISPFTKSQAESLEKLGITVDFYKVTLKKGLGLFKDIYQLRRVQKSYDVVHAHYSTNALIALLAGTRKKLITSFLGSDIFGFRNEYQKKSKVSYIILFITRLVTHFAPLIIVKSEEMKNNLSKKAHKKIHIIPNGVDFNMFKPISQESARKELGLSSHEKLVLFLANPEDKNKNFKLAKTAFNILQKSNVTLLAPYPIPYKQVPLYLNAVDVLLITSITEGSSNILKEALACNCSVISVSVGDAVKNLSNIENCAISSYQAEDIAKKISVILKSNKGSNGRKSINHLENKLIAKKIIGLYKSI